MKRHVLAMLLSMAALSATNAWGTPPPARAKGEARQRRSPASKWMPKTIRQRLGGHRGESTQGPELQGGTLEGSVVRGAIDSDPARPPAESEFTGFRRGMRPFVMKVVGRMEDPCMPGGSALALYELSMDGENPCAGEALAPEFDRARMPACAQEHWEAYRGKALAVQGGWGVGMSYVAAPPNQPFSTFTCLSGALAKCMRLGYRPWAGEGQRELLEACIRAMRADYCGTGMSYTCAGTVFDVADASGIQRREAHPPAGETLEADWTPEGARCLNTPRLPGCTESVEIQRLLQVIAEECASHRHPIQVGGCAESCAEGPTCGSPVRTWAVPGQGNRCEVSNAYCPADASSGR
jgi:hypothetical protein